MNSALIIVEGLTDKGFIEGIVEKLQVPCKVRIMRGNRPERASRLLKALMGEFSKAIVLKDLHRAGRETTTLINKLASKIRQIESQGLQSQVIIVKRSIESWILAGLSVNNPEEILNPEEELKELMQKKGKHYVKSPEIYKRLAKEVDIKEAIAKSETFKNFIEILERVRRDPPHAA